MLTLKLCGMAIPTPDGFFHYPELWSSLKIKQHLAFQIKENSASALWQTLSLTENHFIALQFSAGQTRWLTAEEALLANDEGWSSTQFPDLVRMDVFHVLASDEGVGFGAVRDLEQRYYPDVGLYRCADRSSLRLRSSFQLSAPLPPEQPMLLLLPDMCSTVADSFLDLWTSHQGYQPTRYLQRLFQLYNEQVFAFEYHSLSVPPLENALQLVQQLPPNARLDILAYGTGGIVAEILCQAAEQCFTEQDYQQLKRQGETELAQQLQTLCQFMQTRRIQVHLSVNIATPLRGLLLAHWPWSASISLLQNILRLHPLASPRQMEYLSALFWTVQVNPVQADALLGWHSLRADSDLIRLLNRPNIALQSQQAVIAGELEGVLPLKNWLSHWFDAAFIAGDHDYIVNTRSMQGGAKRIGGCYYYLSCHRGSHHYHYLRDPACLERLVSIVNAPELDQQWQRLLPQEPTFLGRSVAITEANNPDTNATKPALKRDKGIVIMIPDFMGSQLSYQDKVIWLEKSALHWGEFTDLKLATDNVQPQSVLQEEQAAFVEQLAMQHEIWHFAYDWRLAPADNVAPLLALLKKALEQREEQALTYPIRLLAQGSGGLIMLQLIKRHPLVWQRLVDDADARLVLLATPLRGTAIAWQLMRGEHRLITLLDLLQGRADDRAMLGQQFADYPAIQALLPQGDFTWLADFAWDAERMLYIRGEASLTPVEPDEETAGAWRASSQGDGVVTWQAVPNAIPQWHLPLEHGQMLSVQRYFSALIELLDHGHTTLLQRVMQAESPLPLVRMPTITLDLFPTMQEVRAAALGYHTRKTREEMLPPVELLITHGNLEHTSRVLILGHYQGEAIVNAESALDQRLNGRLRELHRLGIYPGELNSAEVLLNSGKQPAGAIIIGLGEVGKLTTNDLAMSYGQGLLRYAMSRRDELTQTAQRDDSDRAYLAIELSTLLIGTIASGLTLKESIIAILRGVKRANAALKKAAGEQTFLRIQSLEVVELYEDKAIEAARHLQTLLQHAEFRDNFTLNSWVRRSLGGFSRVMYAEPSGWWQRIQITGSEQGLSFLALTNRARAESVLQATQRQLVDQFVNKATDSQNKGECDLGTVLFEMLLPNSFKDQTASSDSLVLVVNSEAAAYPWELLHNRRDAEQLPMAVRTGLVRQLQTKRFREIVINPTERSALVIGNPPLTFLARLPAAQKEAETVANLLQQYEFSPLQREIDTPAASILCNLYEQDYRVLHIAAHGVHLYDKGNGELVTGVVIGDGEFLTAIEIEQMRKVPEFVFVNCCHLGRLDTTEDTALDQASTQKRHQFAASFADALIGMGVRAVIVAGWAINDRAAQVFAETCYRSLLAGESFGEAIWRARRDTWQRYPEFNTWGAYQCYGDPDYYLIAPQERGLSEQRNQIKTPQFMAQIEVLVELSNLINAADSGRMGEYEWLIRQLKVVHEVIPAEWLRDAAIQQKLGRAYGKLDQFSEAISAYKRCLQAETADFSLAMLEDLVSIQTAYALSIHLNSTASERDNVAWQEQITSLMSEALQTLDWLDDLGNVIPPMQGLMSGPVCAKTLLRLEERGKYWKRKSIILGAEQCQAALAQMEIAYWDAQQFSKDYHRRIAPYPLLNWLSCRLLRQRRQELILTQADMNTLYDFLERAELQVQLQEREQATFCTAIAGVEALLARYLWQSVPQTSDRKATKVITFTDIKASYQQALARGAPLRQIRFISEHVEFLFSLLQGYYRDSAEQQNLLALKQYFADLSLDQFFPLSR